MNRKMITFQLTSNYPLSMYYLGSFRCQIYTSYYGHSYFSTCRLFTWSIVSLQLYFDKVTELTLNKSDSVLFKQALLSLATDSGLHPLVPYFTCFIADEVCYMTYNNCLLVGRNLYSLFVAYLKCVHFHSGFSWLK